MLQRLGEYRNAKGVTRPESRRGVIGLIGGGRIVTEAAAVVKPTQQTIYNRWNRHPVCTSRRSRAQICGLPGPKNRKKVPRVVTAAERMDRDFARVVPDRL